MIMATQQTVRPLGVASCALTDLTSVDHKALTDETITLYQRGRIQLEGEQTASFSIGLC